MDERGRRKNYQRKEKRSEEVRLEEIQPKNEICPSSKAHRTHASRITWMIGCELVYFVLPGPGLICVFPVIFCFPIFPLCRRTREREREDGE